MTDTIILVKIGLKEHFGNILAAMGLRTPAKGSSIYMLKRISRRAQAHLCLSAPPVRLERTCARAYL